MRCGANSKCGTHSVMSEQPYTPLIQSRSGVRPVKTDARVGEHTVPALWKSCILIEPFFAAHASIFGVLAVPLLYPKSGYGRKKVKSVGQSISKAHHLSPAHPISSPSCRRKTAIILQYWYFLKYASKIGDNYRPDIRRTEVGTGPQVLQTREWPIRR